MSHCCQHFHSFMDEQIDSLCRAVDEDKWYLSEQAGYDVGHELAMQNFIQHHLDRFAHDFRVQYCSGRCAGRRDCGLAPWVEAIPASRAPQADNACPPDRTNPAA